MRIISGEHKGRRFYPPKNFKARPTTDFAKENLFNILSNFTDWDEVNGLDLFGGTGAISFELVSRGAKNVICIEKDRIHADFIQKTKDTLRATELLLLRGDVFKYLENTKQSFNFIFADPPYDMDPEKFYSLATTILEKDFLEEGGIFILEHPESCDFSEYSHFREKREYGKVNFSIFVR